MKLTIVAGLLVLLCSTCVFSSPLGLLKLGKLHKLRKLNPLHALGKLVAPAKPDVEVIPLSEYPVWRLHHYKGLELKPVALPEVLPEAPPTAYPPPSTEFVDTNPKPDAVYNDPEDSLSILDGGYAMLDGVRDAFSTIGHRITGLPSRILSTIGLGEEEEEAAGLLPSLPSLGDLVHLPATVLEGLPKLPSLPLTVLKGKKKVPAIYVVVNKPEHKEKPVVTYEPPKEQTPVTYEAPKPSPTIYEVPKEVVTTYEAPKPSFQQPPFELPTTYENPRPVYGAPIQTYSVPSNTYGPPDGLVPPFAPSKAVLANPVENSIHLDARLNKAQSRSDEVEPLSRVTELPPQEPTPVFKPSPVEPVVILPENKTE